MLLSEGLICLVLLNGVSQGPWHASTSELDSPTPQPGTSSPSILTQPALSSPTIFGFMSPSRCSSNPAQPLSCLLVTLPMHSPLTILSSESCVCS